VQEFIRFIKFALFSASAGLIEMGSFALLNEFTAWSYWPCYLIALVLSVVWNFTLNRKFTFKSAANVPIAMLKVLAFYCVFTPVSTLLGNYFTAKYADVTAINYIVLACTMACNMTTEFLYDKFVVFKGSENTAVKEK
jgi:putative flippase GtrA